MDSLEEVQARHRKENKDLQGRITQKKKQATKKTRKGVNDECVELERRLKETQAAELSALRGDPKEDVSDVESEPENDASVAPSQDESLTANLQKTAISDPAPSEEGSEPKRNRQKERLARRAAEQEAEAIKAEEEAAKLPNWKRQERTAMLKAFKTHKLDEKEIRPDGHCLFSSVADQLDQAGIDLGTKNEAEKIEAFRYKAVRRTAAKYIEGHPDEFEAFLEEPLPAYVQKIENSAEWGGQVELIALAKSYNVEICVLQDGRLDKFSPEDTEKEAEKIWLAYYHHGYGLGEHYNSLRKAP
ncbi:OTU protein [Pseudogymnoascus australis]